MATILSFYASEMPGWQVLTRDSNPEKMFSRAQAINNGVRIADSQIVVVNDADCLCPVDQVKEAVAWARGAPGLVYAYTRYRRLSRQTSESLSREPWRPQAAWFGDGIEWQLENAPSQSVIAIRRDDFLAIGGYDERFQGWGYEDLEFLHRAQKYAPVRRVPGDLYHLWHGDRRPDDSPLSEDERLVRANWRLYQEIVNT